MKKKEFLFMLSTFNIKPDTFRRCNAGAAGSNPGKMQRTASKKAAGRPEKLNQRHQSKERQVYYMTTLTLNQELNGIEITFDQKPLQGTLDGLKKLGFRWHRQKKLWYAKQTPERLELAKAITESVDYAEKVRKEEPKKETKKENIYGVKVGDIFCASWGYEQTNNDFFQVIALVGKQSVRVREVHPEIINCDPISGMSEDRVYKITSEILQPAPSSVFIKDQENGDLKRIKPGYFQDEEEAKKHCYFDLGSYASAYKCNGETEKVYESWYY